MAHKSAIEWTEATWNPWHGCRKVSQGCKNCYMFRDKSRYVQDPNVVVRSKTRFNDPLKWQEPKLIFTCSWSDFFIEEADPWRDEAFEIMYKTPQHTYQVLTKRPDRMLDYISRNAWLTNDPLPNVWFGVSVEDQKTADERIPLLLETPAAVRWLSIEPLLGPVTLTQIPTGHWAYGKVDVTAGYLCGDHPDDIYVDPEARDLQFKEPDEWERGPHAIDWVVVGGESGPAARPMHPDWVRSLRDQCTAAGVRFFFKQWGAYMPDSSVGAQTIDYTGKFQPLFPSPVDGHVEPRAAVRRIGKKKAGRILDGRTWDEMPKAGS